MYIHSRKCRSIINRNNHIQGRSTKIKTGQAIDDVTQTRGAAGMPPGCSVNTFGAILCPSTIQ